MIITRLEVSNNDITATRAHASTAKEMKLFLKQGQPILRSGREQIKSRAIVFVFAERDAANAAKHLSEFLAPKKVSIVELKQKFIMTQMDIENIAPRMSVVSTPIAVVTPNAARVGCDFSLLADFPQAQKHIRQSEVSGRTARAVLQEQVNQDRPSPVLIRLQTAYVGLATPNRFRPLKVALTPVSKPRTPMKAVSQPRTSKAQAVSKAMQVRNS